MSVVAVKKYHLEDGSIRIEMAADSYASSAYGAKVMKIVETSIPEIKVGFTGSLANGLMMRSLLEDRDFLDDLWSCPGEVELNRILKKRYIPLLLNELGYSYGDDSAKQTFIIAIRSNIYVCWLQNINQVKEGKIIDENAIYFTVFSVDNYFAIGVADDLAVGAMAAGLSPKDAINAIYGLNEYIAPPTNEVSYVVKKAIEND